jgi:hypothetical protein
VRAVENRILMQAYFEHVSGTVRRLTETCDEDHNEWRKNFGRGGPELQTISLIWQPFFPWLVIRQAGVSLDGVQRVLH